VAFVIYLVLTLAGYEFRGSLTPAECGNYLE